ncbi:modifier of mdg4 isoform X6 [Hermetia illucens]|uniref:modifier of mdg4 isoform X6 n=1 Tax=Hermetia illucens TaxID=343691 RepID=UPI0018CC3F74|nr:modifier of mdg4 isoform X6 [Hermetia illucens]
MADDEQFSLCWNNFNSNLSAGFHESLCRGDLVDVTLAAEGQFVKAHRLVLSVCSPYFRRMFTQMPANQHAFVFLKDVSHTALKDLIQFMYCGEVNVKQDALPAFISTAEALQIKGLTDSEPAPSQSPAKPSTPAPQPQPQTITTPTMTTATTTTSPRARTSNQRSRYKLESEDSGDENKPTNQLVLQQTQTTQQHQQATLVQQTQKRPAQRSITPHTAPTVKRIKNNDPLEGTDATTTTTQITVQAVTDSKSATGEPEYIDLPIDLPTKSEPDYGEEAADVEAAEQEATYVEDDSYGDMKYDESYFTENEEGGGTTTGATTSTAAVKQSVSFSDSYVSDTGEQQQAATEAQAYLEKGRVLFIRSQKKNAQLVHNGYIYNKKIALSNGKTTWRCADLLKKKCKAVCITKDNQLVAMRRSHCHDHHWEKIIPKDLYYEEEDLDELIEIRPSESLPITEILKTSQLEIVDGAYKVIVPPLNVKPATSGQPVPKMKN